MIAPLFRAGEKHPPKNLLGTLVPCLLFMQKKNSFPYAANLSIEIHPRGLFFSLAGNLAEKEI